MLRGILRIRLVDWDPPEASPTPAWGDLTDDAISVTYLRSDLYFEYVC